VIRKEGFYWVQLIKGTWEVVEYYNGAWAVSDDYLLSDSHMYAIDAERIKEPDYQP
jgi:hypothetical protein